MGKPQSGQWHHGVTDLCLVPSGSGAAWSHLTQKAAAFQTHPNSLCGTKFLGKQSLELIGF